MTSTLKMEKFLINLSAVEINYILKKWNLHISGTKADKLLRLEQATQERFPDISPNSFNYATLLSADNEDENEEIEVIDEAQEGTSNQEAINMKEMIDNMQLMFQRLTANQNTADKNTPAAMSTTNGYNDQSQAANRVNLCSFWKKDPELWFMTAEQKFRSHGIISSDIKFAKVVDALSSDDAMVNQISNVMKSTSLADKYEAAKQQLIDTFKISEEKKIQRILSEMFLGDKKPSLLFREMKDLACNKIADDFLFTLWMQKLPSQIEPYLRGLRTIATPDQILSIADGMADCSSSRIDAIKDSNQNNLLHTVSDKLDKVIKLLESNFNRRESRSTSEIHLDPSVQTVNVIITVASKKKQPDALLHAATKLS